eukprot:TRINITY_DN29657_c0_g1_i1.p1 TRINITY_DN29657_c0_g1~~TRINITY_DN29657_c0_g1_i1.p1  ORF type:complete len:600 (-),score=152.80 TRINITY_DN29657_c0_g1_i1:363-2162(-)
MREMTRNWAPLATTICVPCLGMFSNCVVLQRLGTPVKTDVMQALVKAGDCEQNGAIDYVGFVSWLIEGHLRDTRKVPTLGLGTNAGGLTGADDAPGRARPKDTSTSETGARNQASEDEDALRHVLAWLRGVGSSLSKDSFMDMIKKVDSRLSEQEISEIFEEVDWDNSGALDAEELENWMRNDLAGQDFVPKLLDYFKGSAARARQVPSLALGTSSVMASTADRGLELHRPEAAATTATADAKEGSVDEAALQHVLSWLRAAGTVLTKDSFLTMMKKVDSQLSEHEISDIFEEVDWDNSGGLDAEELEDWMRNDLEGRDFVPKLLQYFKAAATRARKVPSLALGASSTIASPAVDNLDVHRPVDVSISPELEAKESSVNEEALQHVLTWLRGVGPSICKESFSEMLKKVDSQLSEREISDIFEEVDWDGSGALDASELEDWMRNDLEGRDFIPKLLEYFKAGASKARHVPSLALGTTFAVASTADDGLERHRSKDVSASEGAEGNAGWANEDTLQKVLAWLRGAGPSLSKEGFLEMMKKADSELSEREISDIFEEVDWDSSGDLDAEELEDWMRNDLEGREFVPKLLQYFKKNSGKVRG